MLLIAAQYPAMANRAPLGFLQDLQRGGAADSAAEQGLPCGRVHARHRQAGQSQRGGRRSAGLGRGHPQSPAG